MILLSVSKSLNFLFPYGKELCADHACSFLGLFDCGFYFYFQKLMTIMFPFRLMKYNG